MVLTQWWLALLALLALLVGVGVRIWLLSRDVRPEVAGLPVAHMDRVRAVPRFQQLIKQWRRWLRVELLATILMVAGTLFMIARPVTVSDSSREMRSRDVMLCLDVSGSMAEADKVVLESYLRLVDKLRGERIGLVVWDSSASLAFPLTDDHVFIKEQLESLISVFADAGQGVVAADGRAVLSGTRLGAGSSLIGDGFMSCLLRFDQSAEKRPRTVVLATDNQLAGRPIFSFAEAGRKALEDGVLVMGVSPALREGIEKDEFHRVVEASGGKLLEITDDPLMEQKISETVRKQQRKAIRNAPAARSFDLVWPGATLFAFGLFLALVASRRSAE